ncbi:hypothetical protein HZI73_18215 [Vallitalea pronyensis]|uniref:Uncharacterized protein n=1 Tax=Vallitalea pronyensis TaxID=1348613 RepID=A0A8J8MMB9_9FIRM|nr:hypothetical protein [Vallitalea pronyensis]QUI24109.1 hypothetical protein HZI73_18215 [Vallitalea pronyensis]
MNNFKDFFTLGKLSVSYVMHKIFYIGILVIAFKAYLFAKGIYLTHTYMKGIEFVQDGQHLFTSTEVPNKPLAIFGFIIFFIIVLVIWKFICELLIKFFSYFES